MKQQKLRDGDALAYCIAPPPKGEADNQPAIDAAREEWWRAYFATHANGYTAMSELDPMDAGFNAYFNRLATDYKLTPADANRLSWDINFFHSLYLSMFVPAEDVYEAHPERFECVGGLES